MERTEEMIQLATRLVALLIEERSQMNREIGQLREDVAGLREMIASMSFPPAETPGDVPDSRSEMVQEPEPEEEKDSSLSSEDEDSGPAFEPMESHEPELEFIYEPEPDNEPGSVSEPDPEHMTGPEPGLEPESEPVPESNPEPDQGVLRPRNREEQMNDTSEWGMYFNSDINVSFDDDEGESIIGDLMDFQEKPAEPVWMTDVPGPRVKSVYDALSNNDRVLFIRELFDEDGEQFSLSMDRIDSAPDFGQVVKEMRIAFPDWDEDSDIVYQFYMMVRRRFE